MRPYRDAPAAGPGRTALLLVNLGTPEAPTRGAVKRYLAEFLHDHRVVELTRWLWCPILHFIILPLRSGKVARNYASIWMDEGSPLLVHTRRLAKAMPADAGVRYQLGNSLARQGDVQGAIDSYREALLRDRQHARAAIATQIDSDRPTMVISVFDIRLPITGSRPARNVINTMVLVSGRLMPNIGSTAIR